MEGEEPLRNLLELGAAEETEKSRLRKGWDCAGQSHDVKGSFVRSWRLVWQATRGLLVPLYEPRHGKHPVPLSVVLQSEYKLHRV
jgi:hypothetical protein